MDKKYSNPPIVEALCEFQFIPRQPWDITIPGLLYEKIKEQFPEKQQQVGFGVEVRPEDRKLEQRIEMTQRMRFLRSDKTALVQVGPDLLAINHLKPYPTWHAFKPLILQNLEKYQKIANPKGFKRIGLRYINKIEFSIESIELSDYFNYYAFTPKGLPQVHDAFNVHVEIPYGERNEYLLLTLRKVIPEHPETISIVLDLDYITAKSESVPSERVPDWLENAHTNIEKAFESCITDKCRNFF